MNLIKKLYNSNRNINASMEEKMRKKKIALVILLIIAGLLLIFSKKLSGEYVRYKQRAAVIDVREKITPEQIKVNQTRPVNNEEFFDFKQVKPLSVEENIKTPPNYDAENVIGLLNIPEKEIYMPIYKGVMNENLKTGAGTMRPEQKMGVGNYPLAGHHYTIHNVLFNRVPELEAGQRIYITDKNTTYTYTVYDNQRVPETAVHLIEDKISADRKKPVLTLVTCFSIGETGERILVFAELTKTQPYDADAFNALKD